MNVMGSNTRLGWFAISYSFIITELVSRFPQYSKSDVSLINNNDFKLPR